MMSSLPWWAWSYFTIFVVMSCFGFADSIRRGRPLWHIAGNTLSSLGFGAMILAFWHVPLRENLGKAIVPMFVFAFLWNVVTTPHDLKEVLDREKDVTAEQRDEMENSALTMMFVLLAPGYIFGAILCANALGF
jgi:hypothetical protein